jgi:hypothetical protein
MPLLRKSASGPTLIVPRVRLPRQSWGAQVLPLLLPLLAAGCGGTETEDGVSYAKDVKPILESRCVLCHTERSTFNLADPFTSSMSSLFNHRTEWADEENEYTQGREIDIVPGDPDGSFLVEKITDPALKPTFCDPSAGIGCAYMPAGIFMPPAPRRLTDTQINKVRQWIADGAQNDSVFRDEIANAIFNPTAVNGDLCGPYGSVKNCIPCASCHYTGAPTFPDLQQNQWENLVGVRAHFRSDLLLVDPGNPDTSFLMLKLEATKATSEVGGPMPYGFPPLLDDQVATIREWIADGARNN